MKEFSSWYCVPQLLSPIYFSICDCQFVRRGRAIRFLSFIHLFFSMRILFIRSGVFPSSPMEKLCFLRPRLRPRTVSRDLYRTSLGDRNFQSTLGTENSRCSHHPQKSLEFDKGSVPLPPLISELLLFIVRVAESERASKQRSD